MGIWIEYRCENRTKPSAEGIGMHLGQRCFSRDNAGPMGMAGNTRAKVNEMLVSLDKDARDNGWLKTAEGWFCPFCAGQLGLN